MTRFYSKGKIGIDLDPLQWKKVDELRQKRNGVAAPQNIHHRGEKAWITGFSRLLKRILEEDNA